MNESFSPAKRLLLSKKTLENVTTLDGTQRHGLPTAVKHTACGTFLFICSYISFPTHPFLSDKWLICKELFNQDRWHVNSAPDCQEQIGQVLLGSSLFIVTLLIFFQQCSATFSKELKSTMYNFGLHRPILDWICIQIRGCECIRAM